MRSSPHESWKEWTGPDFPRVLLVEIAHPTPIEWQIHADQGLEVASSISYA
jgi:hypothetical protein